MLQEAPCCCWQTSSIPAWPTSSSYLLPSYKVDVDLSLRQCAAWSWAESRCGVWACSVWSQLLLILRCWLESPFPPKGHSVWCHGCMEVEWKLPLMVIRWWTKRCHSCGERDLGFSSIFYTLPNLETVILQQIESWCEDGSSSRRSDDVIANYHSMLVIMGGCECTIC